MPKFGIPVSTVYQLIKNSVYLWKRLSKEILVSIDNLLEKQIREILEGAKRKADFAGRKTIVAEDL